MAAPTSDQIFDALKDTLLASLIDAERVTFAGEPPVLEYLRRYFDGVSARAAHRYLPIDEGRAAWDQAVRGRRVIVAAAPDEAALAGRVRDRVAESGLAGEVPVLRLFADSFVNLACGDDPTAVREEVEPPPTLAYAIVGTPR